jgi:paraquat-inducible protein B
MKVFVNTPFDKFVSASTRFWNASGIDVSVGAGGFDVRTQSLVALIAGGLAFETPPFIEDTQPAAADTVFDLFGDEVTAMKQPDRLAAHYVLHFDEPLRGLSVGAPVTLLGLPGGAVTEVGFDLDPKTQSIRGRVEIVAYPERINQRMRAGQRAAGDAVVQSLQQRQALIRRLIEQRGLRAQLRTGSLLTGQLYVAFDFYPKAPPVKIDWTQNPVELPVVASPILDIENRLSSILAKIDALPFDAIGSDLKTSLVTFNKTLKDTDQAINKFSTDVTPELKTAIEAFRSAAASADLVLKNTDATLLGKDAPGQQELRNALQEFSRAARSVRILTDYLELHPEALIRGKTEEKQ